MTLLLSKIFWIFAAPGNFLVLLLILGTLSQAATRRRHGFRLVAAAAVGLLAIVVLPTGQWLLIPLESRFEVPASLPERIDGIIVLGGATDGVLSAARGEMVLNGAGTRITDAVVLVRRYASARILLSGGDNHLVAKASPEAAVMKAFFVTEGIDAERIMLESQSRTTFENAVLSRAEAQPQPGENWLLVTSAVHMPRAIGCFRAAGWRVIAYPVDYRTTGRLSLVSEFSLSEQLALVNLAAKEWIGLLIYYIMGRTDALFPG